jgi:hypothetical protein
VPTPTCGVSYVFMGDRLVITTSGRVYVYDVVADL